MDFIKNIYKSIDTEKNFMYRKNNQNKEETKDEQQVRMNNCTFYYFSFQGYYFYPDYFVAMNHRQKLMSL